MTAGPPGNEQPGLAEMRLAGQELESMMAELTDLTHEIEAEVEQVKEEQQQEDERARDQETEAEEAIRRGEHGRAFQVLQQRIDLNQTTMADVLADRDEHWSAREVRGQVVDAVRETIDHEESVDEEFSRDYRATANARPPEQGPGEWPPFEP